MCLLKYSPHTQTEKLVLINEIVYLIKKRRLHIYDTASHMTLKYTKNDTNFKQINIVHNSFFKLLDEKYGLISRACKT